MNFEDVNKIDSNSSANAIIFVSWLLKEADIWESTWHNNGLNMVHGEPSQQLEILPEEIREVIGPGGKVINKIIDETGVKIDTFDDGRIAITADSRENGERAKEMINEIVKEIEVGEIYSGVITTITNFGAFVELIKGKEGLLHISNMTHERLNKVEDLFKVGDVVEVKVIEIDNQGKIKLSRKALLEKPKKDKEKEEK